MRMKNRDIGKVRREFKHDVMELLGEGVPEIDIDILLWLQMQKAREWTALVDQIEKCEIEGDLLEEMLDERFDELEDEENK